VPAFRKILVANRGEIASRVMRTCPAMGIGTAVVWSDPDRDAPFVREADEAVYIGPPLASASFLAIEKMVEVARRVGADAVHPGDGFRCDVHRAESRGHPPHGEQDRGEADDGGRGRAGRARIHARGARRPCGRRARQEPRLSAPGEGIARRRRARAGWQRTSACACIKPRARRA
jgi:hypothetical protein